MTTLIPPPPPTVPIGRTTDGRAVLIDSAWALYLTKGLLERLGGFEAPSNSELAVALHDDAGIEETKAWLYQATHEAAALPPVVQLPPQDNPDALIQALTEQVAEMRREIEAIKAGTVL